MKIKQSGNLNAKALRVAKQIEALRKNVPVFKNSQDAFTQAIQNGRLSTDQKATNYAGHYMYMGTWNGIDKFKHVMTREYLKEVA